jgi:hypothetical protein
MEKSVDGRLELTLPMLRDLVNKLAVISGHCDLLGDDLKEGSQCAKRVGAIQEIARGMAKGLNEYQCQLSGSAQARESKNLMSRRPNALSNVGERHWDSTPRMRTIRGSHSNENP